MRTTPPILIVSTLVAVAVAAVVASFVVIDGPDDDATTPQRTTSQAQTASLAKQVSLSGSIESAAVWDVGGDGSSVLRDTAGTSSISAAGGSKVASVAVKVGQRVQRGQVLARVDSTAARLRVTAAQQALDNAIDARDDISTDSGTTVTTSSGAGGGVGASALSGGSSSAMAQSGTGTASARTYAMPTAPTGVVDGGAPTTDGDVVEDDEDSATGGGTTTSGGGQPVTSPKSPAAGAASGGRSAGQAAPRSTTKRESTAAIVARANAAVTSARSALATAKAALAATTLRAPTAGTVVAQNLRRGGSAPSGAALTIRSSGARVTLSVEEADVIGMSIGDAATVSVSAIDASVTGRVAEVGAASGGGRGASSVVTYPVTIVVDEAVAGLHDGMSTSVVITKAEVSDALVVPPTAVRTNAEGTFVRVRRANGRTHDVSVEIGLETERGVQIVDGELEAGDTVELEQATGPTSGSQAVASGRGPMASGFPGGGPSAGMPVPPTGF